MEEDTKKPKSKQIGLVIFAVLGILYLILPNTPNLSLGNLFQGKELTNSKVQRAFNKMEGLQNGRVAVNGIRVGQNAGGVTIVDVTLTNFQWRDGNHSTPPYNGPAVGVFTGYTDGRYTLKEVSLSGAASHPTFTVDHDTDSE